MRERCSVPARKKVQCKEKEWEWEMSGQAAGHQSATGFWAAKETQFLSPLPALHPTHRTTTFQRRFKTFHQFALLFVVSSTSWIHQKIHLAYSEHYFLHCNVQSLPDVPCTQAFNPLAIFLFLQLVMHWNIKLNMNINPNHSHMYPANVFYHQNAITWHSTWGCQEPYEGENRHTIIHVLK